MRASDQGGRFSIAYEREGIYTGIRADLQRMVGQSVRWWTYDPALSASDEIYDVADSGGVGRVWDGPIEVPVYMAVVFHGRSSQDSRGFYNTDTLRVSASADVIRRLLPDLMVKPDAHLLDRIVHLGQVFTPTQIYLRGMVKDTFTVVTIDASQVNPEELVNDTQFSRDHAR